jgi:trans-aconitate methyltransferase
MTDWHASDYNRISALQQAMADEQLGRLRLEGTERVLDVGCGDGKITAQIAARVPGGSVLGIDPSPAMVDFATKNFGAPAVPNLRFELADARKMTYRDEFDLVVSFNALHWVPEQAAALCSIYAALQPGGKTQLRFVPQGARKSLEDVIEDVRVQPRWAAYFKGFRKPYAHFTPEEYRAMAEKEGFEVVQIRVDDKAWDFKSREAFAAFSRVTFVEWTQHLPEDERTTFINAVLDHYQSVAANSPAEYNTFKFYQMEVVLSRAD